MTRSSVSSTLLYAVVPTVLMFSGCAHHQDAPVISNDTRERLARALEASGDPASAAIVRGGISRRPVAEQQAPLTQAATLIRAGQVDQGLSVAQDALRSHGDDPAFAIEVAKMTMEAGRPAQAAEIYRNVLLAHPANIEAMNGHGVALAQMGKLADATADFRHALTIQPGDVPSRNNLALAMVMSGQSEAAVPVLEDLNKADGASKEVRENLALAYAARRNAAATPPPPAFLAPGGVPRADAPISAPAAVAFTPAGPPAGPVAASPEPGARLSSAPAPGTVILASTPSQVCPAEIAPAAPKAPATAMNPDPASFADETPREVSRASPSHAVRPVEHHADVPPTAPAAAGAPSAAPSSTAPSSAASSTPDDSRISLRASADAWTLVRQKGGPVLLNRLLRAGETWPVPAKAGLLLTTGNAGGVAIVVDGVAMPKIGVSGAVRRDVPLDPDLLKAAKSSLGGPAADPPASASASSATAAAAAAQSTPQATEDSRILLHATADAWTQIREKGGPILLNRLLRAGESWPVPAKSGLLLSTGNAGGVDIIVDGVTAPKIGANGAVRREIPLDPELIKAGRSGPVAAVTSLNTQQ